MSTVVDPNTDEHAVAVADEATASASPETPTCPNCAAPAEPGQLMCLECGSRLALDYQRPPTWRLPTVIIGTVLLIAGLGVAIALAATTGGDTNTTASATQPAAQPAAPQSAPGDAPPTASQPTSTPATASTPAPAAQPSSSTAATPAPADTTATPAPATAGGWPPGQSGFTVVLASMPSKAAADEKLKAAQAAGITSAAILHSDDFPTLNPGYWVVFDGQYDAVGQAQAQAATDRGRGAFTDAYPRFVSKDPNAKP